MADFYLQPPRPANLSGAFLGGMGQVQDLQTGSLQQQAMRQRLEQQKLEEPIRIATAAAQYWDATKATLTPETYGKWREQTRKMFPMIPESEFPPPETFKSPQEFEAFKYQKEIKIAELKRMSQGNKVVGPEQTLYGPQGPIFTAPPSQTKLAAQQESQRVHDYQREHGEAQLAQGERRLAQGERRLQQGDLKAGAGGFQISDEALRVQAEKAIQTGQDPSLGMGNQIRPRYLEIYKDVVKEKGLTPGDLAAQKMEFGAIKTAAGQMDAQAVKIEAFAANFDKNIEVLENLVSTVDQKTGKRDFKKDPRTGTPIINKWIQAGKRSVTGDPDISALDVAVKTVANEFARLTTSATGGGQLAEEEIKKAEGLLAAAQTPEQMEAALSVMKADRTNRVQSFNEQRAILRKRASVTPGAGGDRSDTQQFRTKPGKVSGFVGPGKYNGIVIRTETEFNQHFPGGQ